MYILLEWSSIKTTRNEQTREINDLLIIDLANGDSRPELHD